MSVAGSVRGPSAPSSVMQVSAMTTSASDHGGDAAALSRQSSLAGSHRDDPLVRSQHSQPISNPPSASRTASANNFPQPHPSNPTSDAHGTTPFCPNSARTVLTAHHPSTPLQPSIPPSNPPSAPQPSTARHSSAPSGQPLSNPPSGVLPSAHTTTSMLSHTEASSASLLHKGEVIHPAPPPTVPDGAPPSATTTATSVTSSSSLRTSSSHASSHAATATPPSAEGSKESPSGPPSLPKPPAVASIAALATASPSAYPMLSSLLARGKPLREVAEISEMITILEDHHNRHSPIRPPAPPLPPPPPPLPALWPGVEHTLPSPQLPFPARAASELPPPRLTSADGQLNGLPSAYPDPRALSPLDLGGRHSPVRQWSFTDELRCDVRSPQSDIGPPHYPSSNASLYQRPFHALPFSLLEDDFDTTSTAPIPGLPPASLVAVRDVLRSVPELHSLFRNMDLSNKLVADALAEGLCVRRPDGTWTPDEEVLERLKEQVAKRIQEEYARQRATLEDLELRERECVEKETEVVLKHLTELQLRDHSRILSMSIAKAVHEKSWVRSTAAVAKDDLQMEHAVLDVMWKQCPKAPYFHPPEALSPLSALPGEGLRPTAERCVSPTRSPQPPSPPTPTLPRLTKEELGKLDRDDFLLWLIQQGWDPVDAGSFLTQALSAAEKEQSPVSAEAVSDTQHHGDVGQVSWKRIESLDCNGVPNVTWVREVVGGK